MASSSGVIPRRMTRPASLIAGTVAALLAAGVAPGAAGGNAGEGAPGTAPTVRMVASWTEQGPGQLAEVLRRAGAAVVGRLPIASAVVVDVPRDWQPPAGVTAVPDRTLQVADTTATATAGAVTADLRGTIGARPELSGKGVTVALVDTGVADVADLRGAVEHLNFSGDAQGDGYGHGTFMAGLIAGRGTSSGGPFQGVAPAARILDVQVAAADGSTSLSRVLAGLEAVAKRAEKDDTLRVVNLSLSEDESLAPAVDPLSRAVEALWDLGLVVVVAAGNEGPDAGTVTSPGVDPAAITVGAVADAGTANRADDSVAGFSSRGGTGYAAGKPDVVAPGVSVVGLRAPGSVIDRDFASARVGDSYFRGSGTSMATAATSGAVAALLSAETNLLPDQVKAALTASAYRLPGDRSATGAGGVDLAAAPAAADRVVADEAAWSTNDVSKAWKKFAKAWDKGRYDDAQDAWLALPASLRARAAAAWATAVAADGLVGEDEVARARAWAQDKNLGQAWLARTWSARTWSQADWTARTWSARTWSARTWSVSGWGPTGP
jgi:serine protease AprX